MVKDYVRICRARGRETFVPLAHPPGHAQVDFGEAVAVTGGVRQKIRFFCMLLPQSDACFVKAYSPTQAGLALPPLSNVIGAASRLTGRLTGQIGPRWSLTLGQIITGLGFALLMRADPHASYWTSILPGMAVIALGMAGAIAPLTTAVLSSVDGCHAGTASDFNSATARTGGLIATALAGAVILKWISRGPPFYA